MKNLILKEIERELYINEEKYQEIKKRLKKRGDYFTKEEIRNISKLKW